MSVGALELPLPAGRAQEKLLDPVVSLLLHFYTHCLNENLNDKLAKLNGTSNQAVPIAHAFDFDPDEPRGHKVKRPVPSLYMWWPGQSTETSVTTFVVRRLRNIHMMYIAEELPSRSALELRTGLLNAVAAVLTENSNNGYHPTFPQSGYDGAAVGTYVKDLVGEVATWDFRFLGSQAIRRIGIDDASTAKVGTKTSGKDYPALVAVVEVEELTKRTSSTVPIADSPMTICHDGVPVIERTLTYPDGSNTPDGI